MFKQILLPLDFEYLALYPKVVEAALKLCHPQGQIHLLYVNSARIHHAAAPLYSSELIDKLNKVVEEQLGDFMQANIPSEHQGQIRIKHGVVYDTILAQAKKRQIELIVMPASRPGAKTYLLGSNASKVVRHADCAVLVIR
ncbi:universal stress protein [Oceanisphaera arctica]|uniref:Universal stress protein n=1 Tax=Oceanisphaera arctica TaxID=641510 RepID=A0A2P5TQB3_9GAMM|nr:universal stress protein [Oceanisphaera arctica]PPL17919.1 universal stress protein [Oceanisphaera arctica]GHA24025.1 universal stress protein F [Oceanisphaera arctica]